MEAIVLELVVLEAIIGRWFADRIFMLAAEVALGVEDLQVHCSTAQMRLRSTDPVGSPEDEFWDVLLLHRLIEFNLKFPVVA